MKYRQYFTFIFSLFLLLLQSINSSASENDEIDSSDLRNPTQINTDELDNQSKPLDDVLPEEEVQKERRAQRVYREGRIPRRPIPRNSIPRRSLPSYSIPRVRIPDNNIPRKSIPRNQIPRRSLERSPIERNPIERNPIPRRALPRNRVIDNRETWLQQTTPQDDEE
ncbi:MAG: hypothetical protein VX777_01955 [Chlamydiota bacterium]|nr:hypothetical protein [Chlamydiota bacterium]